MGVPVVIAPHDADAETAVIGLLLYEQVDPDMALAKLDPADFYLPFHAATWECIGKTHADGRPLDAWTVAGVMRAAGHLGEGETLVRFIGEHVPLRSRFDHYAHILIANSRRRRIQRAALDAADAAANYDDPDEIADHLGAVLLDLNQPDADELPEALTTVRDFLDRPGDTKSPWVIPGLLRRDWRAVIVAPEGTGKSVVLRSLAGYAAKGVHPFTGGDIPSVRTLTVDLENPDEPLDDSFRHIDDTMRRRLGADCADDRAWLWRRPEGLDIRQRTDMRRLERVFQHVRPELVCLGPAYKLFTARKGEDHEQVAGDVLDRLNTLRIRYGFGLIMEQHAPHGEGRMRELRPFGSSAWLRWPELGIALDPHKGADAGWQFGHLLRLARWRGDRVVCTWPKWISRGRGLLWVGHYEDEAPPPPMRSA